MKKVYSLILVLLLLISITKAQTINLINENVSQGDTVVIRLKEYKGNIQWQKSIDSINWADISNANTDTMLFIADQTTYFRASVSAGTCMPFISDIAKINVSSKFVIGKDDNSINVNILDETVEVILWRQKSNLDYYFDIDKDGTNDLHLYHYGNNTSNTKYFIFSLNILDTNFRLSMVEEVDTVFHCITTVMYDSIIYDYYIQSNYNSICKDSILNIQETLTPKEYSLFDTLNYSEMWSEESSILSFKNWSEMNGNGLIDIRKEYWMGSAQKYILLKKIVGDKNIYGWIKISLDSYSEIHIHEIALQKE